MGGRRRFRWRRWLRRHTPYFVAGRIPKGSTDCGDHDWYNSDNEVDRCYYCIVGVR